MKPTIRPFERRVLFCLPLQVARKCLAEAPPKNEIAGHASNGLTMLKRECMFSRECTEYEVDMRICIQQKAQTADDGEPGLPGSQPLRSSRRNTSQTHKRPCQGASHRLLRTHCYAGFQVWLRCGLVVIFNREHSLWHRQDWFSTPG